MLLTLIFAFALPTFVPMYFWGESFACAFFVSTMLRLVSFAVGCHHGRRYLRRLNCWITRDDEHPFSPSQVIQLNVTWSVNSFAHYFGDKPFDESIWPCETKFVAFAAAGEGWHNYHHTFPHDYACSELGW